MTHPMDKYPKAPTETIELLQKAFECFAEEHECDLSILIDGYRYSSVSDGYEIGKYLDTHYGWDVDLQFVNALDDLDYIANDYLQKERKKWFEENNVEPPYEIGTQLDKGTIVGIDTYYSGYYLVQQNNDSIGKLLIKFEDARSI